MEPRKPLKEFRSGRVVATIWENTHEPTQRTFLSTTLSKIYRDNEGSWKNTNRYSKSELHDAGKVIQDALDFIGVHEAQNEAGRIDRSQ